MPAKLQKPRSCLLAGIIVLLLAACSALLAQRPQRDGAPDENRPPESSRGPRSNRPGGDPDAKRGNSVSITTEGDFRIIKSNGWPDHAPGEFPRRGNPNTISPQDHNFRVTLKPQANAEPTRRGGWFFAVAVNGVPFEPGTAEVWNNDRTSGWRYEAHTGFLDLGLDEHNAHVQPSGAYHYHAIPAGLVQKLGGDEGKMLLLGWAADGFELFTANCGTGNGGNAVRLFKTSWRLKTGARPGQAGGPGGNYDGRFTEDWEFAKGSGDLDELNGHITPTPAHPEGIYHYHVTTQFPFIPRGWRGTPHESFGKGGMPGGFAPPLIIRTLDANGDGIIDADEIASAVSALRKLDKNGDGKLTPDEYRDPGAPFGRQPGGIPNGRPDAPRGGDPRGPQTRPGGVPSDGPKGGPPGAPPR